MIELTPLARPYAKALFASANETKNLDSLAEELKIMASVSQTEGVINTIENPVLSRKEVVNVLLNLFEESVSDTSKKLLEILHTFVALGNTVVVIEHNLDVIEVFVANEPSNDAKENIEKKLKSTYGEDANISFSKDPKIMGGLSIKVGDETFDLSIRAKVNKLVNQLNF